MPTRPLLLFFSLFLVIVLVSVSARGQSGSAPTPVMIDAGVGSGSDLGAVLVDAGLPTAAPAPSPAPAAPVISADDPLGTITSFYTFVRSGKALPAVGAGLMLVVWGVRKILPGSWSKSTIGGYVIGFGASLILFVASAFVAGTSITLGLVLQALGTAAAASGLWEHVKDLLDATGAKPPLTPAAK